MGQVLARLLNPRFEPGPQTAERIPVAAQALEHWLAEPEPERQRWRCLPRLLGLDYCREQCCRKMTLTMTWALEPNRPKFSQSMGGRSGYEGHGGAARILPGSSVRKQPAGSAPKDVPHRDR
jgi:hypothetical protein